MAGLAEVRRLADLPQPLRCRRGLSAAVGDRRRPRPAGAAWSRPAPRPTASARRGRGGAASELHQGRQRGEVEPGVAPLGRRRPARSGAPRPPRTRSSSMSSASPVTPKVPSRWIAPGAAGDLADLLRVAASGCACRRTCAGPRRPHGRRPCSGPCRWRRWPPGSRPRRTGRAPPGRCGCGARASPSPPPPRPAGGGSARRWRRPGRRRRRRRRVRRGRRVSFFGARHRSARENRSRVTISASRQQAADQRRHGPRAQEHGLGRARARAAGGG